MKKILITGGSGLIGKALVHHLLLNGSYEIAILTRTKKGISKVLEIEWDVIKLSAYANRERPIEFQQKINDHFDLVVHKKPMSGGAATAVTKEAAKKLLASTEKFGRPCDTDIQFFWERGVKVLSLMPYPVAQDLRYESTIETKSHKKDKKPLRRLMQQVSQYWLNKSAVKDAGF